MSVNVAQSSRIAATIARQRWLDARLSVIEARLKITAPPAPVAAPPVELLERQRITQASDERKPVPAREVT